MQVPVSAGTAALPKPVAPGRRILAGAIIALVSIALYLPSLRNGFVFDDEGQLLQNRWITDVRYLPRIFAGGVWDFQARGLTNYYRPLMHVVYLATYQVTGLAPWAFHLVNVLVNAAAAVLVFEMGRLLSGGSDQGVGNGAALMAGLLFAVHPIHSEPVVWVAGLPDLAFTSFALLSILVYARQFRAGTQGSWHALGAAGAFLVACLFKETALVVPALLAAYELLLRPHDRLTSRAKRLAPTVAAALAYLVVRIAAIGSFAPKRGGVEQSATEWALSIPVLFARYVGKALVPLGLNAWHDFRPPTTLASATGLWSLLVVAAVVAVVVATLRSDRRIAFALLLFLVPLLPAFYLRAITGGRFSERYLYMPSAGIAIAAGLLWARIATRRSIAIGSAIALVLVGGAAVAIVVQRIPVWHDSVSLWTDVVSKSPRLPDARYNLGVALRASGDRGGAMREFQQALALGPGPVVESTSLDNLGLLYEEQGQFNTAFALYDRALRAWPDNATAHLNLGGSLAQSGRLGEAEEHFRAALRMQPESPVAHFNLGLVLVDQGKLDEGILELETASRLRPSDEGFRAELAKAYLRRGRAPAPNGG